MEKLAKEFKALVEAAERIIVTAHISPDPDAVSSLLLMGQSLRLNCPKKQIMIVLEEKPDNLDFLAGLADVKFQPVQQAIEKFKPDLFILLDGNNYERCSRHHGQQIRNYIQKNNVKTAIIDHHEVAGKDAVDVFINRDSPATVQDVYEICFDEFGFKKPEGSEQAAMTGFYADSGGFVYVKAGNQKRLFNFAERLVSGGADIELVKNQLESYSEADMLALSELAANVTGSDNFTYSYLSDGFIGGWTAKGRTHLQLQRPTNTFLNNYIRNIGGRTWGFIVYKNVLQGENFYSASFRSQGGAPDVSAIATRLGGGGHKPAAGAKFEARDVGSAINIVLQAIENKNQS